MPDTFCQNRGVNLDLKLLAKFIYELNIARRHSASYPAGHPVVSSVIAQSLYLLHRLKPEDGTVSLGIARDTLLLGSVPFEQNNPVFRDFACHLFARGIALISFRTGLTEPELDRFLRILELKRPDINAQGGLQRMLDDSRIVNILIKEIDYGLFRKADSTQEKSVARKRPEQRDAHLWERFVAGLMDGLDGPCNDAGSPETDMAPETLACFLNEQDLPASPKTAGFYDQAITEFLREIDREKITDQACTASIGRLKTLATHLNPGLRAQLLNSTFRFLTHRPEIAGGFLKQFPHDLLLETLETLNARQTAVPPVIFNLLTQLAVHRRDNDSIAGGTGSEPPPAALSTASLEPLLRADQSQLFIPGDYQGALHAMGGIVPESETASSCGTDWNDAFFQSSIERKTCNILFLLAESDPAGQEGDFYREILDRLCDQLLALGDFDALADICRRISGNNCRKGAAADWRGKCRALFQRPEMLHRILDALIQWGKEKFEEISRLINEVGSPFVEPLLDRLALEDNRALRHFYIDRLADLGDAARQGALARLGDERWYYLRNLLVVLRRLEDPSVVEHLSSLRHHPHEKVRQEVLETSLVLKTDQGERYLLEELSHPEKTRQLQAVRTARHSRHPDVYDKLLALLNSQDLSSAGCDLKVAVLRTLGEIGKREFLPHLGRKFLAVSLLHPRRQRQLRLAILDSLALYPAEAASSLLRDLARTRRPHLSRLIARTRLAGERETP